MIETEDIKKQKDTVALNEKENQSKRIFGKRILFVLLYAMSILAIMIIGHLLFTVFSHHSIGDSFMSIVGSINSSILLYILGGFVAQMIDGALGMAYGVSVTTFLLSLGIPAITPAVASASMHASEVFTTGTSSLVYMRYKYVNNKLFRILLIPGTLWAVAGAITISYVSKGYVGVIKHFVAL